MKSEVCKWRAPLFLEFGLSHGQSVPVGAFVGAACRSLTPAKRSGANGDRQAVETFGTGAFVGELRESSSQPQFSVVRGQPLKPRDFLGMTRVFNDDCCGIVVVSGETEDGSAGTQPSKG